MSPASRPDRAQLVLVAAAVAAAALVPMALAYLTLGAHPDVTVDTEATLDPDDTVRALDRAVANASGRADGLPWGARTTAVERFDAAVASDVAGIESSRLVASVVVTVARNETAATAWARTDCPRGPNRAFGPCEVIEGVVVQERAGEVVVLAVGFDVTVTGPDGTTAMTVVIREE